MVTKITTKLLDSFSRSIETIFFMLLYNQIALKTSEIFEDQDASLLLKNFGSEAAKRSCEAHPTMLKFAPKADELEKIVELIEFLWLIAFGRTPEFKYDILENTENNKLIRLSIFECPLCSGIDQDDLELDKLKKIQEGEEKYACILIGMIQGATKYLMQIQNLQDYEIEIKETACILEKDVMNITVKFYRK
ncbi:MAG: hypothetical protein ACTSVY_09400 [Candidatus Helarchaeota archaeon]